METGWKWWNNHLTKTETFGKGLPALGKRMEGPAHEEVGVGKWGKEAQIFACFPSRGEADGSDPEQTNSLGN